MKTPSDVLGMLQHTTELYDERRNDSRQDIRQLWVVCQHHPVCWFEIMGKFGMCFEFVEYPVQNHLSHDHDPK